jgi:hypothetical protein
MFCLLSLIILRAIQQNAIDPPFQNPEDLLRLPNLQGIYYVPLNWHEKMLNVPVFPISYDNLNKIWHRSLLAACLQRKELDNQPRRKGQR